MNTTPSQLTLNLDALRLALQTERRRRRITWKDVADQTGISASSLSRIVKGKSPSVDTYLTLCDWLGRPAPFAHQQQFYAIEGRDAVWPSVDEAMLEWLEDLPADEWQDLPDYVAVQILRPEQPTADDIPDDLVTNILERLDEKYLADDGEYHPPNKVTENMTAAYHNLRDTILAEYQPNLCTYTGEEVNVHIAQWVLTDWPHWIDEVPEIAAYVTERLPKGGT